jgi:hypothetical protein
VEEEDGDDGDGAQALDVRAEVRLALGHGRLGAGIIRGPGTGQRVRPGAGGHDIVGRLALGGRR